MIIIAIVGWYVIGLICAAIEGFMLAKKVDESGVSKHFELAWDYLIVRLADIWTRWIPALDKIAAMPVVRWLWFIGKGLAWPIDCALIWLLHDEVINFAKRLNTAEQEGS